MHAAASVRRDGENSEAKLSQAIRLQRRGRVL